MKIGLASDHRGFKLKSKLVDYLAKKGYELEDFGTYSTDSVDYPDYGIMIGEMIRDKVIDYGIVICGSGIGISIACNKVKGVRCAKVNSYGEAKLARKDNNANVIALNEKMFVFEAKDIVDAFLNTNFANEERYVRRIDKISSYEDAHIKKTVKKKTTGE